MTIKNSIKERILRKRLPSPVTNDDDDVFFQWYINYGRDYNQRVITE